jgi:hypothetical protein
VSDEIKKPVSSAVAAYMRRIGSKGGKVGGKKKGWCKMRSPDHYKRMQEARKAAYLIRKAEREAAEREAANHVYVVGSYKKNLRRYEPENYVETPVVVAEPPKPVEPTFAPPITFTFTAP